MHGTLQSAKEVGKPAVLGDSQKEAGAVQTLDTMYERAKK